MVLLQNLSCHINSLLFVLCFELFGRMNSFLCFIPHIFAGIKRGQDIYRFFVGLCPTAFASWDICRFCEQLCPITSGVWDIQKIFPELCPSFLDTRDFFSCFFVYVPLLQTYGTFSLLFLYMSLFLGLAGLFPLLFSICPSSLDSRDFLPCFLHMSHLGSAIA